MAKRATKPAVKKPLGGPYLAAAVFCESILADATGGMSAIKILDGCQILLPPNAPEGMPSPTQPIQFATNLLLVLRSGDAPGKHALKLVMEQPDGKRSEMLEQTIELSEAPNGGFSVNTTCGFMLHSNGLFVVDVILDDKLLTRMPFSVSIQRLSITPEIKTGT